MLNRQLALIGALTLMVESVLGAQGVLIVSDSAAGQILAEARSLRCSFDSGVGLEYGQVVRPNTLPLLRPRPLRGGYTNPDVFDNIDRVRQTARAISDLG